MLKRSRSDWVCKAFWCGTVRGAAEGPWPPALNPYEPLQKNCKGKFRVISSFLICIKWMPFVQLVVQDPSRCLKKSCKNCLPFKNFIATLERQVLTKMLKNSRNSVKTFDIFFLLLRSALTLYTTSVCRFCFSSYDLSLFK